MSGRRRNRREQVLAILEQSKGPGCWPWAGNINDQGYGRVNYNGTLYRAHRLMYEWLVEPIPDGLTLDHVCHTTDLTCMAGAKCPHRRCVNPLHMELVTVRVNASRQHRPDACPRGHAYDSVLRTTRAGGPECRRCLTCARLSNAGLLWGVA